MTASAHVPVVARAPPPAARLFLALWPDAKTRRAIARRSAAWTWPPTARRVAPERLHATLHFLGAVARERVAEIADGLEVDFEPCCLGLDAAAVWPRGIAVIEATRPPQALLDLHAALAQGVRALGIAVESRPWRPHVTLARDAADASLPVRVGAIEWGVDEYVLVESTSSPRAEYLGLRRYGRFVDRHASAPVEGPAPPAHPRTSRGAVRR